MSRITTCDETDLAQYRRFQRTSFDTLQAVFTSLEAGITEGDAARRLRKAFHEQGVHSYFHVPVALFGARTSYPGDFGSFGALATEQVLEVGMPVIMDAAPIYDGYVVDTSWATTFGENATYDLLMRELEPYRTLLLDLVKQRESFQSIAKQVNTRIVEAGFENCHTKHIGSVLGHRLFTLRGSHLRPLMLRQLSVQHVGWFLFKSYDAAFRKTSGSPNWNHAATLNYPPPPGVWAVEPHLARDGVGAKFEEAMVITEDDAFWLDDDLPHTRYWREHVTG